MQELEQGAPTGPKESAQYKKLSFDFKLFLLAIWMSLLKDPPIPISRYAHYRICLSQSGICVGVWLGLSVSRLLLDHHWSRLTWWFPPMIHFFFAESIIGSITLGLEFWNNLWFWIWPNLLSFSWIGKLIYDHISIWDVTLIILANRGNHKCGELLQTVITQRSNLIRGWWHITWHPPGRSLVNWDNTGFLLAEITNDPSAPTRGTAWHWIPITRTKLFQITTLWPLSDLESDLSQDDGS